MLYKRKASSPQAAYGSKAPSPVPAPLLRAIIASQPMVSEVGHLSVRSSTGELCSYSFPGTSAVGKHTNLALIKKKKRKNPNPPHTPRFTSAAGCTRSCCAGTDRDGCEGGCRARSLIQYQAPGATIYGTVQRKRFAQHNPTLKSVASPTCP